MDSQRLALAFLVAVAGWSCAPGRASARPDLDRPYRFVPQRSVLTEIRGNQRVTDQNPEEAVVIGHQVIAKVLEVDPIHHRVVVAIIDYPEDGIPEPGSIPPAPVYPADDEIDEDEE